ncbi:MAG: hypothetical protein EP347_12050 [Alphaproteobacteria bacterium]|nr:MAG: hypothetical protein EP347_12050 [Alphaproteobacteria bacterium]
MSRGARRNAVLGVVGVLTLVSFFVVRTLYRVNGFATLSPEAPGQCTRIAAPAGPEDMQLDARSGLVYLSSTDRRALVNGTDDADGDIYLFDPAAPEKGFMPLGLAAQLEGRHFYPHGISLYRDEVGRTTLMVINHPSETENRIEIFDLFEEEIGGALVRQVAFRRSVDDPLIHAPNDLQAVGHDAFYVSNDHGPGGAFMRALDDYVPLSRGTLVYFDGETAEVAADGFSYANGVAISADGRELVVGETTGMSLTFFARDGESGALTLKEKLPLYTGVDNIDRAVDGSYWVGAHPQLLKFGPHAKDPANVSPSHVLKVKPGPEGRGGAVEQIYLGLGDEISGSSVAIEAAGKVFIGQVFDPFLLVCGLGE